MPSFGFYSSSPSSSSTSPIHNSSFSSPSRPQTKRKQVKNACTNCQKACKKCDDQRPCSRCVKYGIEDSCVNSQRKERKRKDSTYSASESPSERSSPLPAMSRSGREIRQVQRQQETIRGSTSRSIRSFPKELLQSLQDDEDFHSHNARFEEQQKQEIFPVTPQVTEEFKTLAQLCSDLHVRIQYQSMNPYVYTPLTSTYPAQAYPMPSPFMYRSMAAVEATASGAAFVYNHHSQFDHRNLMNRTPPEDLPSPVKSEDGKFEETFESSF